jgi:hypothetical protein
LGRSAFLDDEAQRVFRIVDDLLVLQELEKAIVRHILFGAVAGTPTEENGQTDQGKGDGKENNAAPIKIGVTASFIVFLRIPVGLSHGKCYATRGANAKTIMKPSVMQKQEPGRFVAPIIAQPYSAD